MNTLTAEQSRAVNAEFFKDGGPTDPDTFLSTKMKAMGFQGDDGPIVRSGGIEKPQLVTLKPGALIVRFYMKGNERDFGGWWSTTAELKRVFDYFGVSPFALANQRSGNTLQGLKPKQRNRTVLNAILAVRSEWMSKGTEGLQLGSWRLCAVKDPVLAFHGPAYPTVIKGDYSDFLKPLLISDRGRQRAVNQLFIPAPYKYRDAFDDKMAGDVDGGLRALVGIIQRAAPQSFE